jgi:hypothetical protein
MKRLLLVALMTLGLAGGAQAALVTLDPGTGTTTTFTGTPYLGAGPVVVNGISWTGSPQVYSGFGPYGFSSNGSWNWGMVAMATNSSSSITASLGAGYSFVGGFMNYAPGSGFDATIQALAVDGLTVLETYNLTTQAPIVVNGTNAGAFRGIQRAQNDIYYFRLSGAYIAVHTLETAAPSAVPIPTAAWLMVSGIGALGAAARRRKAA